MYNIRDHSFIGVPHFVTSETIVYTFFSVLVLFVFTNYCISMLPLFMVQQGYMYVRQRDPSEPGLALTFVLPSFYTLV